MTRSIIERRATAASESGVPPLEAGDHLSRAEFHRRYEAMPEDVKAELIEGVVYMPSPAGRDHGSVDRIIQGWLLAYEASTPGVGGAVNATVLMAGDSEPQPDASLLIEPACGGQSTEEGGYFAGAPELIVEITSSSESYDLHVKKRVYGQVGVREYVVVTLRDPAVHWSVLREGRYEALQPAADGTLRSETFPGLWLDPAALLSRDKSQVLAVLQQGVSSPEHAAFVKKLAKASKPS